jgi:hypothetical protein
MTKVEALPETTVPSVYRGFRLALVIGGVSAAVAFVGLTVLGHPATGALVLGGYVLGAWNSWRVVESGYRLTAGTAGLKAVSLTSMRRLGYLTVIVIAVAVAFRPIGWTIVIGIAGYQLILVASSIRPLMRDVRRG